MTAFTNSATSKSAAGSLTNSTRFELVRKADVTFRRVHRTKQAYVVRTFDYREKLSLALDYLNNLGIVSVGRNAEFEYINMDEAIRRGEAAARALESAA